MNKMKFWKYFAATFGIYFMSSLLVGLKFDAIGVIGLILGFSAAYIFLGRFLFLLGFSRFGSDGLVLSRRQFSEPGVNWKISGVVLILLICTGLMGMVVFTCLGESIGIFPHYSDVRGNIEAMNHYRATIMWPVYIGSAVLPMVAGFIWQMVVVNVPRRLA